MTDVSVQPAGTQSAEAEWEDRLASPILHSRLHGRAGLRAQMYRTMGLLILRQTEKSVLLYNDLFISLIENWHGTPNETMKLVSNGRNKFPILVFLNNICINKVVKAKTGFSSKDLKNEYNKYCVNILCKFIL